MTPARRFIVRTSLVTSSTIATIVGAQSLALLDLQANSDAEVIPQAVIAEPTATDATPTIITDSAPNITIIRRPANQTTSAAPAISVDTSANSSAMQTNQTAAQIVPPAPVQVQAPVTVSMPQQPTTRSSR